MSGYTPWWLRQLHKIKPLWWRCVHGNYHWRFDDFCGCGIGINGQTIPKHRKLTEEQR